MNATQKIGLLEDVPIRSIFLNENDFSDWIFKEENLNRLAEQLNLPQLNPVERESYVGTYRLDILTEEIDSPENKTIIENMFGTSNHDHLGKLLTYLAGKESIDSHVKNAIWITETARSEHRTAIKILNERFTGTDFYLIEVSFKRIGNSIPAPFFDVIEGPLATPMKNLQKNFSDSENGKIKTNFFTDFWNSFCEFAFNGDENDLSDYCPNFLKKTQRDRNYFYVSASKRLHFPISIGIGCFLKENFYQISFDFPIELKEKIEKIDFSNLTAKFSDYEENGKISEKPNSHEKHYVEFKKSGIDVRNKDNWNSIFKTATDAIKEIIEKIEKVL